MGAGSHPVLHAENELAEDPDHGYGAAVTNSGRVSVARSREATGHPDLPFNPVQLTRLDEALTLSARATGLGFSVYLGELGADPRAKAEELHTGLTASSESVLIAASPGERKVEIVTGEDAARRVSDRGCNLAVMSMVASFKEGDLVGGLVSALRMLADQAGYAHKR